MVSSNHVEKTKSWSISSRSINFCSSTNFNSDTVAPAIIGQVFRKGKRNGRKRGRRTKTGREKIQKIKL